MGYAVAPLHQLVALPRSRDFNDMLSLTLVDLQLDAQNFYLFTYT
jgi:hypothetical protein